jgi:hydroxypyruvate isomerase
MTCAALTHACHQAQQSGLTILIEPLNRYDAPTPAHFNLN